MEILRAYYVHVSYVSYNKHLFMSIEVSIFSFLYI